MILSHRQQSLASKGILSHHAKKTTHLSPWNSPFNRRNPPLFPVFWADISVSKFLFRLKNEGMRTLTFPNRKPNFNERPPYGTMTTEDLAKIFEELGIENEITCPQAFEISEKYHIPKTEIARYCNKQNPRIKIRDCQLGCFNWGYSWADLVFMVEKNNALYSPFFVSQSEVLKYKQYLPSYRTPRSAHPLVRHNCEKERL